MALMSYNAGSGYMKRHSDNSFNLSYLISDRSRVKPETKKYIQKIILMAMIGENHRFQRDEQIQRLKDSSRGDFLKRVQFRHAQTWRSISRKFRVPVSILKFYNRQYKRKNPRFHFINIPNSYVK
jgi:hypothetical protein